MKLLLIYPGGIRVIYKGFSIDEMLDIIRHNLSYEEFETIGWETPSWFK